MNNLEVSNSLIHSSPVYFVVIRKDGSVEMINNTMLNQLGYTWDEVKDADYLNTFIPAEERSGVELIFNDLLKVKHSKIIVNNIIGKDGKRYLVEWHVRITSNDSQRDYFVGVGIDITERRRYEEDLRKSEAKYKNLFYNAVIGMFLVRLEEYTLADCNQRFLDMFEYSQEEKDSIRTFSLWKNENQRVTIRQKMIDEGRVDNYECEMITKYGHVITCLISAKLYREEGIVEGSIVDITERNKVELALQERLKEMTCLLKVSESIQSNISIDDLCSNIIEALIPAMQYPEITIPVLELDGKMYVTDNYINNLSTGIHAQINLKGETRGRLSVYYSEPREFLFPYEQNLLEQISSQLSLYIEKNDARKQLSESETMFRTIFESSRDAVGVSTNGIHIMTNPAYLRVYGYEDDSELIGKSILDLIGVTEKEKIKKYIELRNSEINVPVFYESVGRRKDGSEFPMEVHVSTFKLNNEPYSMTVQRDITARKTAENALQASEELHRKLVATVPDIIIRTDLDGNIIFINEAGVPMWGYTITDRILGKNLISFVDESDKSKAQHNLKAMLNSQIGLQEYRLKSGFGTPLQCEVNGDVLRDSDDNPYGFVFVIRNITERKKNEQELERYRIHLEELVKIRTFELEELNKLLEVELLKQKDTEEKVKTALEKEKELSRLKSKFISITSHEFRTPLTSVYSSIQLIERYGKNLREEDLTKHIERIKKSVKYLTRLLDDVLTISRSDSGNIRFEPQYINLKKLAQSILDDLRLQLKEKQKIHYEYRFKFHECFLDEKLMTFILYNLLSNAVKYSVNGTDVSFIIYSESDNLVFCIQDQGIGIPKEDQANLFEPFNRGSNVGNISGTGLGLSVVKRCVEMHKGTIEFDSSVSKGTTFIIKIPITNKPTNEENINY